MIVFPHPLSAFPDGVLAIGGDLHPDRLELAYSFGIFPWFDPGDLPIWWFPNPRMVLYPAELKVAKSMRTYFNQKKYRITFDNCFREVMNRCRYVNRKDQPFQSWISSELTDSFCVLHQRGLGHSVEVWEGSELVGGLYGISVGKIFFGESMFSIKPNASKFGLIGLAKILYKKGFALIDCQQETNHLASMGARTISAEDFYGEIKKNLLFSTRERSKWADWEFSREV